MVNKPPRLVPNYPLPPYSYVPGQSPHPFSDPAGHSFGIVQKKPAPLDAAAWTQSHEYLTGIDLFNHGYYWEAHEVWEGLWHATGRTGITASFLKGLIKLAAAGVKRRERRAGSSSHARRAREIFAEIRERCGDGRTTFAGLSLSELIQDAETADRLMTVSIEGKSAPVEVVFPFVLRPQPLSTT
jgi:hypothetical protein